MTDTDDADSTLKFTVLSGKQVKDAAGHGDFVATKKMLMAK